MRGLVGETERRAFLEAESLGHRVDGRFGRQDLLRVAAVLALRHHPVAGLDPRHAGTDRLDHAGALFAR
jgi:hypothetical protein